MYVSVAAVTFSPVLKVRRPVAVGAD